MGEVYTQGGVYPYCTQGGVYPYCTQGGIPPTVPWWVSLLLYHAGYVRQYHAGMPVSTMLGVPRGVLPCTSGCPSVYLRVSFLHVLVKNVGHT